jgi:hypothetical protein
MLSRELMGVLALGILWLNTLLVVGAAWGALRELLKRLRSMRALGVLEVSSDEVIATHRVMQVGRRASDDADRKAILFHDRDYESVVHGGLVRALDSERCGDAEWRIAASERAEVWVQHDEQERAGACESAERFDEAYRMSGKARGFERQVDTALRGRVWIVGQRNNDSIVAPDDAPLLLSSFEPARWCRIKVAWMIAFILATLVLCAAITWLALYPPVFGTVSIAGAALGLVFFLLVQPAGTAVRDAVRVPSRAILRGSWIRSGSEGSGRPAKALYAD